MRRAVLVNKANLGKNIPLICISRRNFSDFTSKLIQGDILIGRVIELLGKNKYIINFRGFNIISESKEEFQKGEFIRAEVRQISPRVILKLIPAEEWKTLNDLTRDKNIFFQTSFILGGRIENCEIKIFSEKRKNKHLRKDSQNIKIYFGITTKNMGQIKIILSLLNKIVDSYIFTEHDSVRLFIENNIGKLKSALKKLGYNLKSLKCSSTRHKISSKDSENLYSFRKLDAIV